MRNNMAIDTWFNVQRYDDYLQDWIPRSNDGSDWYSTLDSAKFFCNQYKLDGERVRIVKEEVVYDPNSST
tara:strand:+ start:524 stop:733 length:210 start_codon:yes stop_codon:yes gene_type:complete